MRCPGLLILLSLAASATAADPLRPWTPALLPETAAGVAWLQYSAWRSFGDSNCLAATESCLKFLLYQRRNPYCEVLLPYGTLVAVRLNAEQRRDPLDAAGGLSRARGCSPRGQPAYPRWRSHLDRWCGGELAKNPAVM